MAARSLARAADGLTMCVGVPMRVVSAEPGVAVCEGRGRRERVGMLLSGDQPVGTWILVYQGSAVRMMTADEAAETGAAPRIRPRSSAGEIPVQSPTCARKSPVGIIAPAV